MIGLKKQQENKIDYLDNLDETEMICDKCNGKGIIPPKLNSNAWPSICTKCQGDGKVDWISNIMGKPRNPQIYDTSSFVVYHTSPPIGSKGDMWFDPMTNRSKRFDGYRWVDV